MFHSEGLICNGIRVWVNKNSYPRATVGFILNYRLMMLSSKVVTINPQSAKEKKILATCSRTL